MLRALSSFPQVSLPSSLCLAPPGGGRAVVTDPMGLVVAAGGKKGPEGEVSSARLQQPSPTLP